MGRDELRRAAEAVSRLLVLPLVMAHKLRLVGYDTMGTCLSLVPGFLGVFLRRAWYETTLERCGSGLTVQFAAVISNPETCIGNTCFIGHFTRVGLSRIGNDVMIAEHCSVIAGGAQYGFMRRDIPMRLQPGYHSQVTIGDDVWIGTASTISSDVASHTVVAAASLVSSRFQEWEIIAGVPATPVATRPARRSRRTSPPIQDEPARPAGA